MNDISEQLRTLVDESAPAISVDEILGRQVSSQRPHVSQRSVFVGAAAAVLLVGAVGTATIVSVRESGTPVLKGSSVAHDPPTVELRDVLSASTLSCIAQPGNDQACPVTLKEAEAMMHMRIRQPTAVPSGWVVINQRVLQWPSGYLGNDVPAGAQFIQTWAPAGTDSTTLNENKIPYIDIHIMTPDPNPEHDPRIGIRRLPLLNVVGDISVRGRSGTTKWPSDNSEFRTGDYGWLEGDQTVMIHSDFVDDETTRSFVMSMASN